MTFKEKLVKLRKRSGITQEEFAKAVGVSRQAVYKWESGQSYPEVAKLLEIKALFNISIDDLLDDGYEVVLPEKTKKRRAKKVEEAAPAPKEEEKVDDTPVEETVPETEEIPEQTPVEPEEKKEEQPEEKPEEKKEEQPRRRGFFARLFGG